MCWATTKTAALGGRQPISLIYFIGFHEICSIENVLTWGRNKIDNKMCFWEGYQVWKFLLVWIKTQASKWGTKIPPKLANLWASMIVACHVTYPQRADKGMARRLLIQSILNGIIRYNLIFHPTLLFKHPKIPKSPSFLVTSVLLPTNSLNLEAYHAKNTSKSLFLIIHKFEQGKFSLFSLFCTWMLWLNHKDFGMNCTTHLRIHTLVWIVWGFGLKFFVKKVMGLNFYTKKCIFMCFYSLLSHWTLRIAQLHECDLITYTLKYDLKLCLVYIPVHVWVCASIGYCTCSHMNSLTLKQGASYFHCYFVVHIPLWLYEWH